MISVVEPQTAGAELITQADGVTAWQITAPSYNPRMIETLTIRLPKSLARELRAKTRAAKTNPTEVLRKAAANYVRAHPKEHNAIVDHIRSRAGTWDGDISGAELLRRTRQ